MAYEVSPLPGQAAYGAVVTNLDMRDLEDPDVRQSLRDLWISAGVILFRGLAQTREVHVGLSKVFGDLVNHVNSAETGSNGDTEVLNVIWSGEEEIYSVNGQEVGNWVPWHIDSIFTDEINRGGMLRPIELPEHGGGLTGFIDRMAAYDALPDELKVRIEGLRVIYRGRFDATEQRFGKAPDLRMVRMSDRLTKVNGKNFPRVVHPLVFTQAETGRKVLNVSPWFSEGIEGMENAEGDALLADVVERCTRPELIYFHQWTPDDMVLWDNWRMLHSCTGVRTSDRRLLRRTTIAGDYSLGQAETAGVNVPEALRRINV